MTDLAGRSEDVALDLSGIFRAIWRAKAVIILPALVVGVLTFLYLSAQPPKYLGDTRVLIESRAVDLGLGEAGGTREAVDQETVASEVQLLSSRDLARRVARNLNLAAEPEFGGASEPSLLGRVLEAVGLGRGATAETPEEQVLDAYFERLSVYQINATRVIVVQFTASDPDLAAAVANEIASEYMAMQAEANVAATSGEADALQREIASLSSEVQAADEAVASFQREHGLFASGVNATTVNQQIVSDLTSDLSQALTARAEAQARVERLEAILDNGGNLEQASDVLNSPTIQALRTREVEIRGQISELSATLLPGHPDIQRLNAQLADIQASIGTEARAVLAGLRNEAALAQTRVQNLTAQLDAARADVSADNDLQVQLAALQRNADARRTTLQSLQSRYQQALATQNADMVPANARVISRASAPSSPYAPTPVPHTIFAVLATVLIMVAIIVAREFLSGRALTPIGPVARVPATVPADGGMARLRRERDRLRVMPGNGLGDPQTAPPAVEALYARLRAEAIKRVAVVGVTGYEGARRLAVELGRRGGAEERVIVLHLDEGEAASAQAGITDLIDATASFADVIRRDPATRAHVIHAGTRPIAAADVDGDAFETLLGALGLTYDLVVMNFGRLTANSELIDLLAVVDHVVLVGGQGPDSYVSGLRTTLKEQGMEQVSVFEDELAVPASAAA